MVGTHLLTKKGGDIKDFAGLKDKIVAVISNITSRVLLNKLSEEQRMNVRIISTKDHGDSLRTLKNGCTVALMMSNALLAGECTKAEKSDNWDIVDKPQSQRACDCILYKDDPQFKKLIGNIIVQVRASGEAERWFGRRFKDPIPPRGLDMSFELSDKMKALPKEPNDKILN